MYPDCSSWYSVSARIDGVLADRHLGQQPPVPRRDLHHVVDARIIADVHFGQSEIGTLAGVSGHDVVDHRAAMSSSDPHNLGTRPRSRTLRRCSC